MLGQGAARADEPDHAAFHGHFVVGLVDFLAHALRGLGDFDAAENVARAGQELAQTTHFDPIARKRRFDQLVDAAGQCFDIARHAIVVVGQAARHGSQIGESFSGTYDGLTC